MISAVTPGINYCSRVPGWPEVLAKGCFRPLSWLSYPASSSTKPELSHSSPAGSPRIGRQISSHVCCALWETTTGMYRPLLLLTQQHYHVSISKKVFVVLFHMWQWSMPHWIRYYVNISHIWGIKHTLLKKATSSWNENAEHSEAFKNMNL